MPGHKSGKYTQKRTSYVKAHVNVTQVFEMTKHTNIYIYTHTQRHTHIHVNKRKLSLYLGKHRVSPTTLTLFDIKTKPNQKTML